MKIEWDWNTFWVSMAAITAAVVVVIPVVERGKNVILDSFDKGWVEDEEPEV